MVISLTLFIFNQMYKKFGAFCYICVIMQRCVLRLLVFLLVLGSCARTPESTNVVYKAPELCKAVPSDAMGLGLFSRLDHGLDRLTDSASVFRKLDYGRLSHARAAIALCNVGTVTPLVIIEAGKADGDTLSAAASLISQADSMGLFPLHTSLSEHNVLMLSTSPTVITVVKRHLDAESSILDAPYFNGAVQHLGNQDALIWRNSGASKLFPGTVSGIPRKQFISFLTGAAEWTVLSGDKIFTVQPQNEKYFSYFLSTLEEGQSKLAQTCPENAELIIDFPIADRKSWRRSYEALLDARVELEAYQDRLKALKKSTGKSPLDWEKENDIQEAVYLACKGYCLNMLRSGKASKKEKVEGVIANAYTGFANALYGAPFEAADSCCIRQGNWIISGPRAVLDTLRLTKLKGWPSKACVAVQTSAHKLTWTKDNTITWQDSNL